MGPYGIKFITKWVPKMDAVRFCSVRPLMCTAHDGQFSHFTYHFILIKIAWTKYVICVLIYIYIYIYIVCVCERERERERERQRDQ